MTGDVTRRGVLAGLASVVASGAIAGAPEVSRRPQARPETRVRIADVPRIRPRLRPELADLIAAAGLGGVVGVVVADMATGRIVERADAAVPLPPASVAKAVTGLYGLDRLGGGARFHTRLFADGVISDGVLHGNLILSGGGDPNLLTDDLAALAVRLRETGLREVRGAFEVWAGALPYVHELEPGQLDHLGYNPALSGLNLNFNRVHFEWVKAGADWRITMDARSETARPDVTMARMRIVNRDLPVFGYEDGGDTDNWTVARGALGTGGARWMPVRHPDLYAAEVFSIFARANGVVLPVASRRAAAPVGRVVAEHAGPPLTDLVRDMLLYSTNVTAEAIGLTASATDGPMPRILSQSAREMAQWVLHRTGTAARFADHSGLSDASRISAAGMVRLLTAPGAASALRPLMKPIPMVDADGKAIADHPVRVVAKTGTLDFVTTLAGYVTGPNGGDLGFAIFAADLDRRQAAKATGDEIPPGSREWNTRARALQQVLLRRWGMAGPAVAPEVAAVE